ncbi:MAG: FtsW/RodA/SpoVE family cell cycle protein, partial [Acidobacteriota bacterium]|nr:FtsW/RodA/SpoVE family cell cycle protein [Acidobacteriota bacterium]
MARKLQTDEWLFGAAAGLALFGVVMVYSASGALAFREGSSQYQYVLKQGFWTVAGLVGMFLMMHVDYGWLRHRWIVAGGLAVTVLLLVAVFAFPRINGAHRWIRLGFVSFQPSELAKLSLMIFLARFLERRAGEEHDLLKTFAPCLLMTGLLTGLVALEPDLGTAMMLGVICLVLLYTAGARTLHLGLMGGAALVGVVAMIAMFPWRMKRMMAFLDPWADPQGSGYQVVQSLLAVGSGGT